MNNAKLQETNNIKVLVTGDFMLDKYVIGNIDRISPEAPIPVLQVNDTTKKLGGGGNVVSNVISLGANVRVLTCIGQDVAGEQIISLLNNFEKNKIDLDFLYINEATKTSVKTRIVSQKHQVVRIDEEDIQECPDVFLKFVQKNEDKIFDEINSVVISDYGKGIVSHQFCQFIINAARKRNIPILVDPKGINWDKYKGSTLCTPNFTEFSLVSKSKIKNNNEDFIKENASSICQELTLDFLVITRSEDGISVVKPNKEKYDFPAIKQEVIDVSGAGDTVISVIAIYLGMGLNIVDCCPIANLAASIVVSKFGTATVSFDELMGNIILSKIEKEVLFENSVYLGNYLRKLGKKIVFTNGCFDIIHAGHISSFEQAKNFGDILIVGLNSDNSVRKLKGENRPLISQENRLSLLKALKIIDYVILFDDETPKQLIDNIIPDVLVKGKDYVGLEVVGSDTVIKNGGKVELIDLSQGLSTSILIEKICNTYGYKRNEVE